MAARVVLHETGRFEQREVDCVEVYLPKRLKHLAELYAFLRAKVSDRLGETVLDGFSIYEVDGVFYGREQLWDERTLVVRLLLVRASKSPHARHAVEASVQRRIKDLGRELSGKVAIDEEEIWICSYPQQVTVFYPRKIITEGT
ncbi:MAG TPA: hypothetical protein VJ783_01845 [Pirellulales bacterium]|nr:hypothetical protein [Pirellulales bacterium]